MVDELNVFPVPDGDTGTNMSMTIKGAAAELSRLSDDVLVSSVADIAANEMLRSARGNSGVILSLLFRGLSKGLAGKKTANALDYALALNLGVDAAYASVMKPTEGTILTVAQLAAKAAGEYAEKNADDFEGMFKIFEKSAKEALDDTPNLLPVLKQAGVVDAGGMGYLVIIKGMRQAIEGKNSVEKVNDELDAAFRSTIKEFDIDIKFTYCTEYIIMKAAEVKDSKLLRAYLETIGDSVVVVDGGSIIKVHVHTEHPGSALEEGLKFGALTGLKIENMKEQNKNRQIKTGDRKRPFFTAQKPLEKYGFVAVTGGVGLEALFKDLGVNYVVQGGQTNNPPADDILEAILATPAQNVFVLPNKKNIIMAAEQAAKMVKDRQVMVLQTMTVPQGISAMMNFDSGMEAGENSIAMTSAFGHVGTGLVTYAARDSVFDGRNIKKGDILGMENGRLAAVEKDVFRALNRVLKRLVKSHTKFITLIYGSDVSDEAAGKVYEHAREKLPGHIEVSLINGGQSIYYYIVSAE
jgi:DAK2 domain fusion protein YloV